MRGRRTVILAVLLAATTAQAAPPLALSDEDRATLDLRQKYGDVDGKASQAARNHGQAENIAALDYILASHNLDVPHFALLRSYGDGFRSAAKPTAEARTLRRIAGAPAQP